MKFQFIKYILTQLLFSIIFFIIVYIIVENVEFLDSLKFENLDNVDIVLYFLLCSNVTVLLTNSIYYFPKMNRNLKNILASLRDTLEYSRTFDEFSNLIKQQRLKTIYVSRKLYDKMYSSNDQVNQKLYFYYDEEGRYVSNYCAVIVDPYKKNYQFSKHKHNAYIRTIDDIYTL